MAEISREEVEEKVRDCIELLHKKLVEDNVHWRTREEVYKIIKNVFEVE